MKLVDLWSWFRRPTSVGTPGRAGTMSLEDFRGQRPLVGVPIEDLAAAVAALPARPDFSEARIIQIEGRPKGHLVVKTGHGQGARFGGGKLVLMRRTGAGRDFVEVGLWRS